MFSACSQGTNASCFSNRRPAHHTANTLFPPLVVYITHNTGKSHIQVPWFLLLCTQAQAAQLEETKAALLARQAALQEAGSGSAGASQAPAAQQLVARTRELAVLQGLQVCSC